MGEDPEGIGVVRARFGAVCAGAVNRGEWNNCAAEALYVVVTINGDHVVVLGACDRHILGVKAFMADICTGEAIMVTSPEALDDTITQEDLDYVGGIWEPEPIPYAAG